MAARTFEKTNFGWQVQQLQQRIGEWLELQLSRNQPNRSTSSGLDWLWELLRWLIFEPPLWLKAVYWVLLSLLVIWLALQLVRGLEPYLKSLRFQIGNLASKQVTSSVRELSTEAWLKRSQEFYRQGNYGEACRALYMAMLQRLNDTAIAPHQPSRTDGEYLQIIQQLPQHPAYQTLLRTHERLCFDNAEISSEIYDQCQQAYQEIDTQLAKS